MIVVTVILILSLIAGMIYAPVRQKACVTVARYDLKKFFEAEQAYLTENNEFAGKAGEVISNAPGIPSTFYLPEYAPSKNTFITITNMDPFTAEARQLGIDVVFECDIHTGVIKEK